MPAATVANAASGGNMPAHNNDATAMTRPPNILDYYPEYASTSHLDDLRQTEYGYLDEQDHVYLDYTGSGLASRAQHEAHAKRHANMVLGNPHSASPTSEAATELVEQTRLRVLQHLNASPDEYAVIFTPNATGAARLVGEAYRFRPNSRFVLTADNHNSLNGIREYARRAGASTTYVPCTRPDLTVDPAALNKSLPPASQRKANKTGSRSGGGGLFSWLFSSCLGASTDDEDDDSEQEYMTTPNNQDFQLPHHADDHRHDSGLFAYPAQSNFSGVRHSLSWVRIAQARGYDVLLDAAAYLPTGTLDLSVVHPDFVLISWYKLFGYPTGVGCLVARREALGRLDRPWFSGGTIRAVSVALDWYKEAHRAEAQFEDGTVNFQAIPDVHVGLDWLSRGVGFPALQTRVKCLTNFFVERLVRLAHSNGQPMVVLYGPRAGPNRGSTVTFNFVDPHGVVVDERIVSAEAAAVRISLRTGCFCNPGAGETALALTHAELRVLQHLAIVTLPSDHGHGHSDQMSTSSTEKSVEMVHQQEQKDHNSSDHSILSGITEKVASTQFLPGGAETPIAGAVRVSFGVASNTADVERFFAFAETYRNRIADNSHLLPRSEC